MPTSVKNLKNVFKPVQPLRSTRQSIMASLPKYDVAMRDCAMRPRLQNEEEDLERDLQGLQDTMKTI